MIWTGFNLLGPVTTALNRSQPVSAGLNQSQLVLIGLNDLNQFPPARYGLNWLGPVSTIRLNRLSPVSTGFNWLQPISTGLKQLHQLKLIEIIETD